MQFWFYFGAIGTISTIPLSDAERQHIHWKLDSFNLTEIERYKDGIVKIIENSDIVKERERKIDR